MSSLIPGFRLMLCSGASLCCGAFSFLWRQITQFFCVAALGLAWLPAAAATANTQHTITFDHYSLMIDGNRVFIYSGEFHPFRLPSPDLWLDVFQKMKAGGFNTICCYFDWDYHSPKSGTYDFTGIRDLDRFLSLASEAGLYVIVRPGPYINAETDSGGFPGWLTTIQGRARSTAQDYLAAACQWLSQVDPIIARHQLTNGTGSIIACQVENEFYDSSSVGQQYMQDLENKMRADGIQVPLTGNHNATFTAGLGATDIAGFDIYPQGFDASNPTQWNPVPEWLEASHDALPSNEPLYLPEFQGGSFDPWAGAGYPDCYILTGPDFENVFYKSLIAQGATMISYYMTYGGTSWGWLPYPGVYSSYDYGSAINEARQLTGKYGEQKLIGSFTRAVSSLAKTVPTSPNPPTDSNLTLTERFDPDDQTEIYLLAHSDTTSSTVEQSHITVDLSPRTGFTYDDTSSALVYQGSWTHASNQSWTVGDYKGTESFSDTAGDSVSVTFSGTAIRFITPKDSNHGIADIYLDGTLVDSVDTYAPTKLYQVVLYDVYGLPAGTHVLKIAVSGRQNPASQGTFVAVDAIDLPPGNSTNFYPSVPQQPGTAITVNGRDAKLLLANYQFGAQRLVYSTSQLMTSGSDNNADFAVLYDNQGNNGETVLRYTSQPTVRVLQGTVTTAWDSAKGDLRLNYVHNGLARVLVQTGSGSLLLILADTATAEQLWPLQVQGHAVLVSGPYLIRSAQMAGDTLLLTGDTSGPTQLSVLFPQSVKPVWQGSLSGPPQVSLPALTHWKFQFESPERNPVFDDSSWTAANHTTTSNPNPPGSLPVLYEDDYGFHHGDVWYRGHFVATGNETGITIDGEGGGNSLYSVWLNGALLGTPASGSNNFAFPAGVLQSGHDNVVSVLVMNMGHDEDYSSNDSYKSPRGIRTATLLGANPAIQWKIQGSIGGETLVDPVRGPMNIGGLYGERHGWFLPGYPDQNWRKVSLPDGWSTAGLPPGIGWYRTEFSLQLPANTDVPIGVQINDDPSRHYRALIFLNGWMLGIYINDLGPQHIFSLPNGILNPNGLNTLAIAVWGEDASAGLGSVSLYQYGAYAGGIPVIPVSSPGWSGTWGAPGLSNNLAISLSSNLPVSIGGQTAKIAGTVTNAGSSAVQSVKVALNAPSGWTVTPSSPIEFPAIPPGTSVSVNWSVEIPSGLTPGQYQLAAITSYTERGTSNSTAGTVALQVPYPNLAAAFDNAGVTSNSNTNPSPGFLGFDGIGTTYSAEGLTAPGLSPGATVQVGGVTLTWPDVQPAQPDNVLADGQAFLISGQSSQLGFLLASNNASLAGTGTMYYTDGSSASFELVAGNFWYQSGQNGNPVETQVAAVNYANYPTGSSGHTVYVFGVTVPTDSSKTVQAVVLPKVRGSVAGYQGAMHIFAVGH
ncbi:MAG: beta-galactosidase [Verrucomicrobia bacterium]|nr:beta-galactosidase [Verrucomicrobiota bacterium]